MITADNERKVATSSLLVNILLCLLSLCIKQLAISVSTHNLDIEFYVLKKPEANSNSGSKVGHFLTRGCTLQHYFKRHCLLKESHGLKKVVQECCFENGNVHDVIYI